MFAYISKINGNDIKHYTQAIVCLYYNVDDNDDDGGSDDGSDSDAYLFNTQTIAKWMTQTTPSSNDGIPPMFSYN
uniref:Uncharacterized protein n=1 Tax=viral metagenome TaxID=1070528 RepID=A0A6C0LLD1_9ZZZZ